MKLVKGGVCLFALLCLGILGATTVNAAPVGWGNQTVHVLSQNSVSAMPPHANTCYGTTTQIYVRFGGDVTACVLGQPSTTRLARYLGANGQFAYAVALSDEPQYTKVYGLCATYSWCAYGADGDTLLLQMPVSQYRSGHAIIKDFSHYLRKQSIPEPHFSFEYDGEYEVIGTGTQHRPTGAVAVSPNGRWAVVELLEYGFVRIDMRDGSYRRVVAPGVKYGVGTDPSFELAVSNDGRSLAITGWRAGIDIYEMDGVCGDVLTEQSLVYASEGTVACKTARIDRDELFPAFFAAHMPRFSSDGSKLSLVIAASSGYISASLSPAAPLPDVASLYVALGDSFVSGEGETDDAYYVLGTNTTTNTCHVSTRSYPYLLHPSLPMDVVNRSCSGSRTEDVRQQLAGLPDVREAQIPTILSVGVGGNDVNVMGKLKACIMPGTCDWALPEHRMKTALEIKSIYPKLVALFDEVQQAQPQSTLFVVGYPKVIASGDETNCQFPISAMLDAEERRYMNETVGYLNAVLQQAARYKGHQFIDVSDVFNGERLCDVTETAMNGIRAGDDFAPIAALESVKIIGAESFHPTPRGHELVANRILEVFNQEGFGTYCVSCLFSPVSLMPSPYWVEHDSGENVPLPVSDRFIVVDAAQLGESLSFDFPSGSFAPRSEVRLELHSEVQQLGVYSTMDDGSLSGTVKVPNVQGYHTVHAFGLTASGAAVDRYQVLYIGTATPQPVASSPPSIRPAGTLVKMSALSSNSSAIKSIPSLGNTAASPLAVLGQKTKANGGEKVNHTDSSEGVIYVWLALGVVLIGILIATAYSIGRRQV